MLRGSGTEPILRIYAEAGSDRAAESLLKLGIKLTRQVWRGFPRSVPRAAGKIPFSSLWTPLSSRRTLEDGCGRIRRN